MKNSPIYSPFRILIFISVLALILYVANLVVYEAVAGLFRLSVRELWLLGVTLGIMSGSFLVASILGMRFYNLFTRSLYHASAVWMGFFVYFFFASVGYGVFILFTVPEAVLLGQVLLVVAFGLGIYGVLHARRIKVTMVEVHLPNLPTVWQGRKAIWVSDLHLGQLHGPEFARMVTEKINDLPHDVVFIGGDLYDGTGAPDVTELAAPLRGLVAPLGVFFVTGNHEEIGDSEAFVKAVQAAGIRTLMDEMVVIDDLQIVGVDYRNASDRDRFATILGRLDIDTTKPSVLLKHEPKDLDIARDAGISLQISGHTHRAQLWPLGYIAALVYKGFSYGLKPLGSLQVYTSSGVGTWGPPMRVGTDCEIVHISFK